MILPKGGCSVMQRRVEAPDSLDYFPTPPWATRALMPFLHGLDDNIHAATCWEPACGEGHMAAVLAETFDHVTASDVFDYGYGDVRDFLAPSAFEPGWIITNPPFKIAVQFAHLALSRALRGVAMLVRTSWLEGGSRYTDLFSQTPPSLILQYAERVPMTKGRWDPDASTATSYCWVVWRRGEGRAYVGPTRFDWIPPGQRKALTRPDDAERFGVKTDSPLFGSDAA